MDTIKQIIIKDGKAVVHDGVAAGLGALGGGLVAKATGVADALASGDWGTLEYIGLGLASMTGLAAWTGVRAVLARIFGGRS